MVPAPRFARNAYPQSSRFLYTLLSFGSQSVSRFLRRDAITHDAGNVLVKRESEFDPHQPKYIVFAVLIPVLVLMSGVFAGLTLGYMSLDETQLNVLSISGTPKQRQYAEKIKPIRKNGHLLLVTLLLANMIVNESLPVIADPVLGGGFESVVVSTVLIVIFAEIIPQSLFTRHGLYLGAKMAGFTKFLIYFMGIIAWPVAKLLEFVLGSHHGIIYRRAELKELIAMHSSHATHGGDLKTDTVTIIGATLDLQEKVVKQAMTPISDVFMLSIDSKLDYELLKKICQTGHSRVPVYEEVEVPISNPSEDMYSGDIKPRTQTMKKILGILLVKQCVLLDPKDATPLRQIPLNKVPFVPNNEPLLGILDKFQEGRSHMAIVSRFSVEKAASVKKAVKRGLTQRLRERVGMGDSDSSDEEKDSDKKRKGDIAEETEDGDTLRDEVTRESKYVVEVTGGNGISTPPKRSAFKGQGRNRRAANRDVEMGAIEEHATNEEKSGEGRKSRRTSFQLPKAAASMTSMSMLEQSMPADAVLAKEGADEFLQNFDPAVMPLGIITLEDVLEELIGEEIYDEFDLQGARGDPYEVPPAKNLSPETTSPTSEGTAFPSKQTTTLPILMPTALMAFGGLGFLRSRSAPPTPREPEPGQDIDEKSDGGSSNEDDLPVYLPRTHSNIEMPRPMISTSRQIPTVVVEKYGSSPLSSPTSLQHETVPGTASDGKNKSLAIPGTTSTVSAPPSRTASPAPAMGAVLLDRKRRLIGTTSATTSVVGSTASLNVTAGGGATIVSGVGAVVPARNPSAKGTRFKSSPLNGGDRAGIVVAEMVKDDAARADNVDKEGRGN